MRLILLSDTELTVEQKIVSDLNADRTVDKDDVNVLIQILFGDMEHCPADTNKDGFINEKNNIKYAGYFYDAETGLYYLNARFYDPETARFIQQDTYSGNILDPLSLNLYTYAQNNPISYYDPTGHSIKSVLKKAKDAVTKATSKVTSAVKKTVTSTASTVKKAATATKNAVVSASKEFRNDWQSGIDQLKQSGTAGKIFASYSEDVVHNLDNTAAGTVQLVKDPLGTVSESVNYFRADPLRNNPIATVGQYYKDIAKASYTSDWGTVANKVGSGTATIAVMGIIVTLAEGGASKLLPKGINIDKTLRLPMLEMYEYAGVGGFELGVSTVSIPIKASISAGAVSVGKRGSGGAVRGHILVDDVPINR